MGKRIDLTGKRYGRLVAVRQAGKGKRGCHLLWECVCDCGNRKIIRSADLRNKKTQSCGCLRKEKATKHGMRNSSTYKSWHSMLQRCTNKNNTRFSDYGGRGINVCERWLKFENFLEDMGIRPLNTTIDRIDNNGNYAPSNCKWSMPTAQAKNQRIYSNNKVGNRGVHFRISSGKYQASISVNGKRYHLGSYDTAEEAIAARRQGEIKYWGKEIIRENKQT